MQAHKPLRLVGLVVNSLPRRANLVLARFEAHDIWLTLLGVDDGHIILSETIQNVEFLVCWASGFAVAEYLTVGELKRSNRCCREVAPPSEGRSSFADPELSLGPTRDCLTQDKCVSSVEAFAFLSDEHLDFKQAIQVRLEFVE